jgi:tRNA A-37 threonylcarbamoyl transferase component Bud32
MPAARPCPRCGAALPADAPEGLCPECLLRQALCPPSRPDADSTGSIPFASGPTPPTPAELAEHFPHLEILELLGQGGMGVVYKARQAHLDRPVALKILPPGSGRDPAFAERFLREARALAKLSHPGIVAVHDFGKTGELYFLVMEYVDGVNLRHLLRSGKLQPDEALRIVPQICAALQYAHEQGVVHRDVKPENILLDKLGRVKIADFGLAKLLGQPAADSALTGSRQVMGTPQYMAPEQVERPLAVDHRADIYSLGVVFYEMLTGELPLGRFDPPSQKVCVDVRLDEVVLRALTKELDRRYQRASDVQTDVETIAARQRKVPVARSPRPRARVRWGVTFWMAVLIFGLFTLAGQGWYYAAAQWSPDASLLGLSVVLSGLGFCGWLLCWRDRAEPPVLKGLKWLLICFNVAVLLVCLALTHPAAVPWGFSYQTGNALERAVKELIYQVVLARLIALPWLILVAAAVLSVGVYRFAGRYLLPPDAVRK